ncbi:MAG: AAA family ATPase [Pseudomonadota bacterium]
MKMQEAVVAFLSDPRTHGGVAPEHIETHLSHLFLAGDRAIKLKKARLWSMVDYTTLAAREHYCRKELALNARFAPELYLGVRAVTNGAGLKIDGDGEVVDWLVEMRRFAHDAQLDVVVDEGRFTPDLADKTADAIASLHRTAPIVRIGGYHDMVSRIVDQLETDVIARVDATLHDLVEQWAQASRAHVARHAGQLDARGRHGFVRRCHGDLHLSNICLWEGMPTPFDALEFSDEIATIDILYDLAFVLVDLSHRGHCDTSGRLMSRYLEWTRDYTGLTLLPLFSGLRSMVRALVAASKGRAPDALIAAAQRQITASRNPRLVAIGGLSGTGKTTLARALAPRLDAVVLRSDSTRKHLAGVLPEARLPQSAYTPHQSAAVYRRLFKDARRVLRAGWPVIVDATFLDPAERAAVEAVAKAADAPFHGVWLEGRRDILMDRVRARTGDASDADADVLAHQLRRDIGPMSWQRLDVEGNRDVVARDLAVAITP